MIATVKLISEYSESLPLKDREYAKDFIKERKFDDLQDLIDSALVKINKSFVSGDINPEYLELNTSNIETLQTLVFEYRSQFIIDINQEDEDIEEIDEFIDDEEY